jgi:hypothetical protein
MKTPEALAETPENWAGFYLKEKGWMEIRPRFKIQYPMKNRDKDASLISEIKTFAEKIFCPFRLKMKKLRLFNVSFSGNALFEAGLPQLECNHFFRYITSFTSFTVRGTSGKAAATRLGA